MVTVTISSSNLHLASQSYYAAGAQYLIIIWTSKGDHLQGTMSMVTLKMRQASRLTDNFQIISGIQA